MLILGLKGLRPSRNMSLSFFFLLWQSHRHVLFDKGDFFQFYNHMLNLQILAQTLHCLYHMKSLFDAIYYLEQICPFI